MELNSYHRTMMWCIISYIFLCFYPWITYAKGTKRPDFDREQYQPIHVGVNNGIFHEPRENIDLIFQNLKAVREGPINNFEKGGFSKANAPKSSRPPTPRVQSHSKFYDTTKGLFRSVRKRKTWDSVPFVKNLFGPHTKPLHTARKDKHRTRYRLKTGSKLGHDDLFTKMTSNIEAPVVEVRPKRSTTNNNHSVEDSFTKWALILGGVAFGVIILIIFICVCCRWNAVRRSKDGKTLIPDFTPPVFSVAEGYDNLGCQVDGEHDTCCDDRNTLPTKNTDFRATQGCGNLAESENNFSTTAV